MIYIIYILLVPISLLLTLVAVLLAPILPIFAANEYGFLDNGSKEGFGKRLPSWLSWFMAPDNSLEGDATFERLNPPSYWSQVKWLWRNPAYSFGLKYLEVPYECRVNGDITIKDNDNAKAGWCFIQANKLFLCRVVLRIFSTNRCFYFNAGWNIAGLVDPNVMPKPLKYEATFVFSPRISGFK